MASGEPMAIETTHLSAKRFPALRRNLVKYTSLYTALAEVYDVRLAEAEETIETSLATPREAGLLGTDTGLPMLMLSRVTRWTRRAGRWSGCGRSTGATATSSWRGCGGLRSSGGRGTRIGWGSGGHPRDNAAWRGCGGRRSGGAGEPGSAGGPGVTPGTTQRGAAAAADGAAGRGTRIGWGSGGHPQDNAAWRGCGPGPRSGREPGSYPPGPRDNAAADGAADRRPGSGRESGGIPGTTQPGTTARQPTEGRAATASKAGAERPDTATRPRPPAARPLVYAY
ncbi:hypothetical protein GCM10020221_16180 [Streptomyces thioluteus]|uniref:UbiC transcription regulator-associated domain-containing protein n=1 Tax=Streptomyces thioluteus TaxID=66431 RepID=A0ABN3WM24_STRTU